MKQTSQGDGEIQHRGACHPAAVAPGADGLVHVGSLGVIWPLTRAHRLTAHMIPLVATGPGTRTKQDLRLNKDKNGVGTPS